MLLLRPPARRPRRGAWPGRDTHRRISRLLHYKGMSPKVLGPPCPRGVTGRASVCDRDGCSLRPSTIPHALLHGRLVVFLARLLVGGQGRQHSLFRHAPRNVLRELLEHTLCGQAVCLAETRRELVAIIALANVKPTLAAVPNLNVHDQHWLPRHLVSVRPRRVAARDRRGRGRRLCAARGHVAGFERWLKRRLSRDQFSLLPCPHLNFPRTPPARRDSERDRRAGPAPWPLLQPPTAPGPHPTPPGCELARFPPLTSAQCV